MLFIASEPLELKISMWIYVSCGFEHVFQFSTWDDTMIHVNDFHFVGVEESANQPSICEGVAEASQDKHIVSNRSHV